MCAGLQGCLDPLAEQAQQTRTMMLKMTMMAHPSQPSQHLPQLWSSCHR